jgi:hypothetical protein
VTVKTEIEQQILKFPTFEIQENHPLRKYRVVLCAQTEGKAAFKLAFRGGSNTHQDATTNQERYKRTFAAIGQHKIITSIRKLSTHVLTTTHTFYSYY